MPLTGRFGPEAVEAVAKAVVGMQRLTGQSAEEIVKHFASMSNGVAKWAAEQNRSMHYLTAEQYQYIRSLEAQGRTQDAIVENMRVLQTRLDEARGNLGYLQEAWEGITKAISGASQAMLNWGRTPTLDARIAEAQELLDTARRAAERASKVGLPGGRLQAHTNAEVAKREKDLGELLKLKAEQTSAVASTAAAAAANQKKIEQQTAQHQTSLLSKERAWLDMRQAQAEFAREKERVETERQFRFLEITGSEYRARTIAREEAALAAKQAAINAEIALEKRRVVDKGDQSAQQARLLDLETKRLGVVMERLRLQERISKGEFDGEPVDYNAHVLDFQHSAEVQKALDKRREQSHVGLRELLEFNRSFNVSLILDDEARGRAQIELDERVMRERLDIGALSIEDRKSAEEALAQWRVLRERQLTEELKPEWQRSLAAWADTLGDMKTRRNEFMDGWLARGRDVWMQWATEGKLTTRGLVDFIKAEFARLVYERFLAQSVQSLGNSLFDAFFSAAGASSSGGAGQVTGGSGLKVPGSAGPGTLSAGAAFRGGRGAGTLQAGSAAGRSVIVNITQHVTVNTGDRNELLRAMTVAKDQAKAEIADAIQRGNGMFR